MTMLEGHGLNGNKICVKNWVPNFQQTFLKCQRCKFRCAHLLLEWAPTPVDQSKRMERPFEEDEITQALWDLGSDKAPSPDGFALEFDAEPRINGVIQNSQNTHKATKA